MWRVLAGIIQLVDLIYQCYHFVECMAGFGNVHCMLGFLSYVDFPV